WDCRMEPDRVGAAIFAVFFPRFCRAVVDERFAPEPAELLAGAAAGLTTALLAEDRVGWFGEGRREAALARAIREALNQLAEWLDARYHHLSLDRGEFAKTTVATLRLDAR